VHAGQTQIEDEQVEFVVGHQGGIGFGAAGHVIHCGTSCPEGAQQSIGQNLIVFSYEDSHPCLLLVNIPADWLR
jgi:hypothetical protein